MLQRDIFDCIMMISLNLQHSLAGWNNLDGIWFYKKVNQRVKRTESINLLIPCCQSAFFIPLWLNRPALTRCDKSSQTFALPAICSSIDCTCHPIAHSHLLWNWESDTAIGISAFSASCRKLLLKEAGCDVSPCTIETWHWFTQPYGALEKTCREKSVNPPVVIGPAVWIYPSWAAVSLFTCNITHT